jgi:Ca2+-binding RTX toxin-like protein
VSGQYALAPLNEQGWTLAEIEVMRAHSDQGAFMQANGLGGQLLVGGVGEDTLNGGGGNGDSLYGGLGDDTYIVNSSSDLIIESRNEGTDTVQLASANIGMSATVVNLGAGGFTNIENVVVSATGLYDIFGNEDGNRLAGNESANLIIGDWGDDTLIGGLGVDTLLGGNGRDIFFAGVKLPAYVEKPNVDIVQEDAPSEDDTLMLAIAGGETSIENGVTQSNSLYLTRRLLDEGDSLQIDGQGILNIEDPDLRVEDFTVSYEGVVIANYFEALSYQIENVQFSDGLVMKTADIVQQYGYDFYGTAGNDVMNAGNALGLKTMLAGGGNDRLLGGDENNVLCGEDGDDTLNGGMGSDVLYGGAGSDTYEFGRGSGLDQIDDRFPGRNTISLIGVSSSDVNVVFERLGLYSSLNYQYNNKQDLVIRFKGGASDKLTFHDWWDSASADDNRFVKFSDGVTLNLAQIESRLAAKTFTSGDDTYYAGGNSDNLSGLAGSDEIHGGKGNDTIYGNDGNDRLFGDEGSDQLFGGTGNNTLNGGSGLEHVLC